jgi:iron(III) transport system permease protein
VNPAAVGRTVALVACALILAACVIDPLSGLFRAGLGDGGLGRYGEVLSVAAHRDALLASLELSLASVVGAAAIGLPLAFLTRGLGAFGGALRGLAFAPLLLTPVLGVLGFYFLCGRGGVLARFVPGYEGAFRGMPAVLTVHSLTLFPFFFAFASAALERFDRSLVDAARSLGASPVRAFFTVVVPALLPGLLGAAALTFMSAMGSFTAPYVFGGEERVLTTAIVVARQDAPADAALLSTVLLAASLLSLLPLALIRSRGEGSKGAVAAAPPRKGAGRALGAALATLLALLVAAPLATVVLISFKARGRFGDEGIFDDLGLDHYRAALSGLFGGGFGPEADLAASIGRSLAFAAVATLAGAAFALVLALAARSAGRATRALLVGAAMLPFAVPGTALALALLETYSTRGPLGVGPGWIGLWALLPLAYFVRNLPLHVRATEAALARLPADVEDASRTLGRGPVGTALRIALPLLMPGVLAGVMIAFVTAAGEFVASVLLCTVFTKPASVAIYEAFGGADFGGAAAAGTLLALATAAAAGLIKVAAVLIERTPPRPGDRAPMIPRRKP